MAVKVNFQNGGGRHLRFYWKWNLTSVEVTADLYLPPYNIWWKYLKGQSSYGDLWYSKWRPTIL